MSIAARAFSVSTALTIASVGGVGSAAAFGTTHIEATVGYSHLVIEPFNRQRIIDEFVEELNDTRTMPATWIAAIRSSRVNYDEDYTDIP